MHPEDYPEEPVGDFIPGIYNYCDRWCERCMYTEKCRVFASEKIMMRRMEREKERERSMEENKEFWDQVGKIMDEAEDLIDDSVLPEEKTPFPLFEQEEDKEELEDAMAEYEEKRRRAKQHPVSKVAEQYGENAYRWFEDRKQTVKQHYDPETKFLRVSYPGITDKKLLQKISSAVEVIMWYHFQLPIKVRRAFTSLYEEQDDPELYKGIQKDSDGSASVALMGIDRSLGAWNYLLHHLKPEKESIHPMIRALMWLKVEVEKEFPGALNFQWPPPERK
ncbi:MAG TPA: hypothetical protein ENK25_08620 [Bacteroidetes bacterium]|nr:hypothetical protein [Bacteroidota bacterium]